MRGAYTLNLMKLKLAKAPSKVGKLILNSFHKESTALCKPQGPWICPWGVI